MTTKSKTKRDAFPVTAHRTFFKTNPENNLLSINEGICSIDALNQANCFLEIVIENFRAMDEESQSHLGFSSIYLTKITRAIIESVIMGMEGNSHA